MPPSIEKDGIGCWRAGDIQRLLASEYNVHYRSMSGVSALLLALEWRGSAGTRTTQGRKKARWNLLKKLREELENLAQKYPEKRIELWCQDESRIGQKGRRTHGWAVKGSRPPVPIDTRYKNAYIFGAFCPERDTAVGLVLPWVNTEMMQLHLDEISLQLPDDVHAALIVDGAGWHRSDALKAPKNITLIRIPANSPECNTAEKPWQFLKDNFLSHRVFHSRAAHSIVLQLPASNATATNVANFSRGFL